MVVETLSESSYLIYPLGFIGFFAVTVISFALRDRSYVRTVYIVFIISGLLVANLSGLAFLPFVDYHKYTNVAEEESTHHQIYVEDANGEELRYDTRAAPPSSITQTFNSVDEEQGDETAAFLLERAQEYRTEVESGERGVVEQIRFPLPSVNYQWTAEELEEYDEFVAVNVYTTSIEYESNSHTMSDMDRTLEHRATVDDIDQEED